MWIVYAFAGAFFQAVEMALKKRALQAKGENNVIAFVSFGFAGLLLWGVYILESGHAWFPEKLSMEFFGAMVTLVILNVIAVIFLYKALDIGELSRLMPYMALTSFSLVVPPMLFLGEFPSLSVWWGIVVIFAGVVLMEQWTVAEEQAPGLTSHRQALRYFLVTALCFTCAPTAMKITVRESDGLFASFLSHLLIGVAFGCVIAWKWRKGMKGVIAAIPIHVLPVVFTVGAVIAAANTGINLALETATVAEVFAIKRTMPIFAFLIGVTCFHERGQLRRRITATILMVAGSLLVILSG